ncbi:hypothetical protein BaRGS_00000022, partial [Batillaria attramentaria]
LPYNDLMISSTPDMKFARDKTCREYPVSVCHNIAKSFQAQSYHQLSDNPTRLYSSLGGEGSSSQKARLHQHAGCAAAPYILLS